MKLKINSLEKNEKVKSYWNPLSKKEYMIIIYLAKLYFIYKLKMI